VLSVGKNHWERNHARVKILNKRVSILTGTGDTLCEFKFLNTTGQALVPRSKGFLLKIGEETGPAFVDIELTSIFGWISFSEEFDHPCRPDCFLRTGVHIKEESEDWPPLSNTS
jgi:hypothetical protein